MRGIRALALVFVISAVRSLQAENFLVLPFFNLSSQTSLDWIGESLSESVSEGLASEGVLTFDREARSEAYRRLSIRPYSRLTRASIMRMAEVLDADQVVFGTFQVAAPRVLQVKAQVINIRNISSGPEFLESGQLADLAKMQNHLAWQVLKMVLPDASPSESSFLQSQPPLKVTAIENYIRGLVTPDPEQKYKFFSQAVRIEPQYSRANYQLGTLHYAKKAYKLAQDHFSKVKPSDNRFRTSQFLLGLSCFHLGEYACAERSFAAVADSVPLNEVWNNLAAAQSRNNSAAALDNFRKALDGDANDPDYQFNVGYALFKRGDLEAAAERFRAALDRDPSDSEAVTMLGRCLRRMKLVAARETTQSEGLERVKETYEESAYLQLKAVLERKR